MNGKKVHNLVVMFTFWADKLPKTLRRHSFWYKIVIAVLNNTNNLAN